LPLDYFFYFKRFLISAAVTIDAVLIFIQKKMSKKEILITAIGTMIGAISGYLYYHFVGCSSGTCRITSKPLNCTLYFALIGGLLFNMLVKGNKTK